MEERVENDDANGKDQKTIFCLAGAESEEGSEENAENIDDLVEGKNFQPGGEIDAEVCFD